MASTVVKLRRNLKAVERTAHGAWQVLKAIASTDHPLLAHLIPIRRCNLACTYCNEYDDFSKPVPTEQMLRRVDKLGELGTSVVTISGGEPLLHPDLDVLIRQIRRRGIIAGMITNGYLITADRIRSLNRAGLEHLQISIDNVMPDDVSKKSLKVLDRKLQLLAEHADFHVNINSVVGGGVKNPQDALTIGKPKLNPDGTPVVIERDGEIVVDRQTALAEPDPASLTGRARASVLINRIFPEGLKSAAAIAADAHAGYLNISEKRLIAEWIDLGGTYYNDPCQTRNTDGSCAKLRTVTGLDQAVFATTIEPSMLTQCAGCHVAVGRGASDPPFQAKRLVLTGSVTGDFNVTISMVNNVCNPSMSYLLSYPSSTGNQNAVPPEPTHPHVLDTTSPLYTAILQWITAAQAANGC